MGPKQSKQVQSIDLCLNHPRFTNAKFIVNEKQRNMQTVMGVDNKQYQKWRDRLHKEAPSSEYLLLPVKEQFSAKGLCGSSGTLSLDYQDFPYLLTEQMAHRKGKKRLFQENQLWYLLYAIMAAKKDMKPSFSKIGDVRPHNIFINDQGAIKLANTFSWPRQNTNFTKAFDNQVTYLAPEQVKQLQMGSPQSSKNDNSQLFSIGLTLLSAATLQDFSDAYDLKKHTMNFNKINEKLNEFKLSRAYSDIMKGTICNLCELDQNRRVVAQQLWNWIAPHQQKIKQRQNFYFPSAPQKIHHEVAAVRQYASQSLGPQQHGGHHMQNTQVIRQSGYGGAKLNFPPPIVRTSGQQYHGFANVPNSNQAQSQYIPASGSNTKQGASYSSVPGVSSTTTYQYGSNTAQFGTKTQTGTLPKNIDSTTQQGSESSKLQSVSKKQLTSNKLQSQVTPPK